MRKPEGREAFRRYHEAAIALDGPEVAVLAEASAETGVFMVIGVIELIALVAVLVLVVLLVRASSPLPVLRHRDEPCRPRRAATPSARDSRAHVDGRRCHLLDMRQLGMDKP